MSGSGTVAAIAPRFGNRAEIPRNLSISRTTGLPHRPASSDGQSPVFLSSNPIGRRYRLPELARRCAGLSPATAGLGSAAVPSVSHRRRTVRQTYR